MDHLVLHGRAGKLHDQKERPKTLFVGNGKKSDLDFFNVSSLRTFLTLFDVESYLLAFSK